MKKNENNSDRPPFFSSWGRMYAFVLLNLAFLVLLFSLLTRAFQ